MLDFCLSRQVNMSPVVDSMSAALPAEQQDDLHYASIHLSLNQNDELYSNIRPVQPHSQTEEDEEDVSVVYSIVKYDNASSAPRWATPLTNILISILFLKNNMHWVRNCQCDGFIFPFTVQTIMKMGKIHLHCTAQSTKTYEHNMNLWSIVYVWISKFLETMLKWQ